MAITKYNFIILKNHIENFLLSPFIIIGRLIASFIKNKSEYSTYYFFPFFHIGGAEKVHYLIAQATATKNSIIYFTRKSKGNHFIDEFKKAGCVIKDISGYTDNKWIFPVNLVFRGIVSHQINRQKQKPIVFNGQCNFGYKISPWIKHEIPQIDLIHALNTFSKIRIPFLRFYKKSITVSREIIDKHRELYLTYKMPVHISNDLSFIPFGIHMPRRKEKIFAGDQLSILYVGRGSPEKRIHLIARIAKKIRESNNRISFSFAGDVQKFIPDDLHSYCRFLGVIDEEKELQKVYEEHDILMVTSSTESGPLVIIEAMIKGLVIISTPVGIVPDHILNEKNGFLFSDLTNEDKIVKEGIHFIDTLNGDNEFLKTISKNNIEYAFQTFGIDKFNENYRKLFQNCRTSQ